MADRGRWGREGTNVRGEVENGRYSRIVGSATTTTRMDEEPGGMDRTEVEMEDVRTDDSIETVRSGDGYRTDESVETVRNGGGGASKKRNLETRSPGQEELRVSRKRWDEFELGEVFEELNKKVMDGMKGLVEKMPEMYRQEMEKGIELIMEGMRGVMNGVSDRVTVERRKREAGEMTMEDKLGKVKEEIKDMKREKEAEASYLLKEKVCSSEKAMEDKVLGAMSGLKLLDFNFGEITQDRLKMVRSVVKGIKEDVHPDDRGRLDRIMRRTRVQILGRSTELRRGRDRSIYTVPVMLECQDKGDADELDSILRRVGYFCTFHWPKEIIEFVGKVREEVRKQGYDEQEYFVKVRPELRGREVKIRADVKEKNGGRWQMAAIWQCPPLNRGWWDLIQGILKPVVVGKRGRNDRQ
jgi:hypothetical protein